MHDIGDRLRAWREHHGVSQKDAATRLSVPGRTYQDYERGVRAPGAEAMEAFARAGINANWLLTGEGPMLLQELHELEGSRTQLAHSVAAYGELSEIYQKKLDELCKWQLRAARLQEERDELQSRIEGVIARENAAGAQQINAEAFAAILRGILEARPDAPPERIARLAVEFYIKTIDAGLITPTGIGDGGNKAA